MRHAASNSPRRMCSAQNLNASSLRNAVNPEPPLVSIANPAGITDLRSPEPPGLLLIAFRLVARYFCDMSRQLPASWGRKNPAAVNQQSLGRSGQNEVLSAVSLRQDHVQSFSDLGRCYWTMSKTQQCDRQFVTGYKRRKATWNPGISRASGSGSSTIY